MKRTVIDPTSLIDQHTAWHKWGVQVKVDDSPDPKCWSEKPDPSKVKVNRKLADSLGGWPPPPFDWQGLKYVKTRWD